MLRLLQQVSSSKTPAGQPTTFNTELFTIRLGITKITSINIEYIIIITDFLGSSRKAVDLSGHSEQVFSLALFFSCD